MATHLGEFWPFSIYPMFSQAGKPWKRAVVRDVSTIEDSTIWKNYNHDNLAGEPVPLDDFNINTNDIANLLSKTDTWTEAKVNGVRKLFSKNIGSQELLILQARGMLTEQDSVDVQFIPFIYLSQDTTILNSELKSE
ncbi:hypothetical protein G3570_09055 [Balneolaceae bacterium YR4-1]|uniref:Uncharacterized protein n=2 Tax=Halalkalibaculum roseum TaxID=2709311 RepID=A0A6M1SV00_9BACT|nr:hypothetical protein [Halalkalibaculum roseum]